MAQIVETWKDWNGVDRDTDVTFRTNQLDDNDDTSSLTFSNQVATADGSWGVRTDPLVTPGAQSSHYHTYLGSVLSADANIEDLVGETQNVDPGSQAAEDGQGFPCLFRHNGVMFGVASGVWWPTVFWEGQPMTYKRGIATYYVRQHAFGIYSESEELHPLPNGVGYVTFDCRLVDLGPTNFRITARGANWFDPAVVHVGAFPVASATYQQDIGGVGFGGSKPAGALWTPNFQTYIKLRTPTWGSWSSNPPTNLQDSRFSFGGPNTNAPMHVDYVAAYGSPGNSDVIPDEAELIQDLLDRSVNTLYRGTHTQSRKWEGTRGESATPNTPSEGDPTPQPGTGEVTPIFTWTNDGLQVTFDCSLSTTTDTAITSCTWDFGDSNNGSGEVVQHTYAALGQYTVTVTVNDSGGNSDSISETIDLEDFGLIPTGEGVGFSRNAAAMGFLIATATPDGQRVAVV